MKINFPSQLNLDIQDTQRKDNAKSASFADFLNTAISQVNDLQLQSESLNTALAAGKTDNIHQVMVAAEKAEIALQFTLQVRNKILEAYQEIMRMPV